MKGVIVEIRNDKAIVLSEDGCVTQIRNKGHQIGEVISMNKKTEAPTRRSTVSRKFAAMAASIAALLVIGGGSAWAYATPYSYVSLDVNPSITYTVNIWDRVIDYQVNNDAKEMISKGAIQLKNMSLENAVKATIEEMAKQGYLKQLESNQILITAASSNDEKSAKLIAALKEEITDTVEEQGITDAAIEAEAIGLERVELARQLSEQYSTNGAIVKVSPGKLNLIEKLNLSTSDTAIYNGTPTAIKTLLLDMSVKDIMKSVKEQKADLKHDQNDDQDDDKDKNATASAVQNQLKPDDQDDDQEDNDHNTTASAIKNGKGNPSGEHSNKGGNSSGTDDDDDDDDADNEADTN